MTYNLMVKELLKIIFSADTLITRYSIPEQDESTQLIVSCVQELEEIDEMIRQHFQEETDK